MINGIELNEDVRNLNAIRSEVGMVFQQFNLFPHLSVLSNITLGLRKVRRMPRLNAEALAIQLLERGRHPRAGGEASGPALRRPAAARRHRPCAGDAAQDHAVRRADLGSRPGDDQGGAGRDAGAGRIGHDDARGDARRWASPREVADRLFFFDEGALVEEGTPEHFFTNPREERTKLFLSQIL